MKLKKNILLLDAQTGGHVSVPLDNILAHYDVSDPGQGDFCLIVLKTATGNAGVRVKQSAKEIWERITTDVHPVPAPTPDPTGGAIIKKGYN